MTLCFSHSHSVKVCSKSLLVYLMGCVDEACTVVTGCSLTEKLGCRVDRLSGDVFLGAVRVIVVAFIAKARLFLLLCLLPKQTHLAWPSRLLVLSSLLYQVLSGWLLALVHICANNLQLSKIFIGRSRRQVLMKLLYILLSTLMITHVFESLLNCGILLNAVGLAEQIGRRSTALQGFPTSELRGGRILTRPWLSKEVSQSLLTLLSIA